MHLPAQFPACPSPVYPELHAHVKLPMVSTHIAFASQLWPPPVHSSISEHNTYEIIQYSLERFKCGRRLDCNIPEIVVVIRFTCN